MPAAPFAQGLYHSCSLRAAFPSCHVNRTGRKGVKGVTQAARLARVVAVKDLTHRHQFFRRSWVNRYGILRYCQGPCLVALILMAAAKPYRIRLCQTDTVQTHNLLLRTGTNQLYSTQLTMLGDRRIHRSEGGLISLDLFLTIFSMDSGSIKPMAPMGDG